MRQTDPPPESAYTLRFTISQGYLYVLSLPNSSSVGDSSLIIQFNGWPQRPAYSDDWRLSALTLASLFCFFFPLFQTNNYRDMNGMEFCILTTCSPYTKRGNPRTIKKWLNSVDVWYACTEKVKEGLCARIEDFFFIETVNIELIKYLTIDRIMPSHDWSLIAD